MLKLREARGAAARAPGLGRTVSLHSPGGRLDKSICMTPSEQHTLSLPHPPGRGQNQRSAASEEGTPLVPLPGSEAPTSSMAGLLVP